MHTNVERDDQFLWGTRVERPANRTDAVEKALRRFTQMKAQRALTGMGGKGESVEGCDHEDGAW